MRMLWTSIPALLISASTLSAPTPAPSALESTARAAVLSWGQALIDEVRSTGHAPRLRPMRLIRSGPAEITMIVTVYLTSAVTVTTSSVRYARLDSAAGSVVIGIGEPPGSIGRKVGGLLSALRRFEGETVTRDLRVFYQIYPGHGRVPWCLPLKSSGQRKGPEG